MDKKPAIIESRFNLFYRSWTFRIWRNEQEVLPAYDQKDIREAFDEWVATQRQRTGSHPSGDQAALFIMNQPRVNAIEITDDWGIGMVLYPEWP